jgi:putative Mg2+ transporter-C (MgtC) family protein
MGDEHRVRGLTTAASVWMAAALGVTAGMGWEVTANLGTLLAFLVLSTLREVEAMVPHSGKNTKGSH